MIRAIPRALLGSSMTVRRPADGRHGGTYEEPVEVGPVRFEPAHEASINGYAFSDPNAVGRVWVDGLFSANALIDGEFCAPVGSLVSIDGAPEATVSKVAQLPAFFNDPHHWELELA